MRAHDKKRKPHRIKLSSFSAGIQLLRRLELELSSFRFDIFLVYWETSEKRSRVLGPLKVDSSGLLLWLQYISGLGFRIFLSSLLEYKELVM